MVSNYALFALAIALVQGSKALPSPIKEILLSCVCLGALWGGSIMSAQARINEADADDEAPKGWKRLRFDKEKNTLTEQLAKKKATSASPPDAEAKEKEAAAASGLGVTGEGEGEGKDPNRQEDDGKVPGEVGKSTSKVQTDESLSGVPILMFPGSPEPLEEGSSDDKTAQSKKALVVVPGSWGAPELYCNFAELLLKSLSDDCQESSEVVYVVGYPFTGQTDPSYGAESGEAFLEEESDELNLALRHLQARHAGKVHIVTDGLGGAMLSKALRDLACEVSMINPFSPFASQTPWRHLFMHSSFATAVFGALSAMLSTLPGSLQRHILLSFLGTKDCPKELYSWAEKTFLLRACYWPCQLRLQRSFDAKRDELCEGLREKLEEVGAGKTTTARATIFSTGSSAVPESLEKITTRLDASLPTSLFDPQCCEAVRGHLRQQRTKGGSC